MSGAFLIIDDSYIDRLVASMVIKRTFKTDLVFDVNGGQAGLEWLKSNRQHTGIIVLLDIMMPQMNGFQFLDHFEKLDSAIRERVTIIMLSSTLDDGDQKRAAAHPNVKKLLSKPLSPNELRELTG